MPKEGEPIRIHLAGAALASSSLTLAYFGANFVCAETLDGALHPLYLLLKCRLFLRPGVRNEGVGRIRLVSLELVDALPWNSGCSPLLLMSSHMILRRSTRGIRKLSRTSSRNIFPCAWSPYSPCSGRVIPRRLGLRGRDWRPPALFHEMAYLSL